MAKNCYFIICLFFAVIRIGIAQPGSAGNSNGTRDKVAKVYTSQIGVREKTGHNDGVQVEAYLKYVGLTKGNPWCASYVCWSFGQAGVKNPRAGGCAYLLEQGLCVYRAGKSLSVKSIQRADVFFIWFPDKGRVAHTGFVDAWTPTYVTTVEGNTNQAGSREGDGVYRKIRLARQIYAVANYIDKK